MKRGRPALSPWIDGSVEPVRIGVYQRQTTFRSVPVFALWDGRRWRLGSDDRDDASTVTQRSSVQGVWPWRGLANKP